MASKTVEASRPGPEGDPLVFSVQHFCLHDGPGVRSLVFFKGCPLRCVWCQNPESWSREPELGYKAHLCIGCKTCARVCPSGAVAPGRGTPGPGRDRSRCRLCFACAEQCPSGALTRFGLRRSVASLVAELRAELPLFQASKGGVTLTGGEPTFQAQAAADLALALRSEGVHVAVETCGFYPRTAESKAVGRLFDAVDLVLFDVKLFADADHRRFCGAGNEPVKQNLLELAEAARRGEGPAVWPRLPLIPGVTAEPANLTGWAGFLRSLGLTRLTLVPYHRLGDSKRTWLGLGPAPSFPTPSEADVKAAAELLGAQGIETFTPGEEEWACLQVGPGRDRNPTGVGDDGDDSRKTQDAQQD